MLALVLLAAQDSFTSEACGFRIGRPDDSWKIAEYPTPEAEFAVRVSKSEASVTVFVSRAFDPDASAHCDRIEAAFGKDERLADLKRGTAKLAGADVPTLTMTYLKSYTLFQHYVVRDGRVFTVQAAAPKDEFAAIDFAKILDTFAFVPVSPAARCGSEIEWVKDWEAASAQKKPVMVVFELYAGLDVEPRSMSAAFMDPDVIALARAEFVALRWRYGMRAPFQSPKVYGLGPSTFGGGILFVTPEGKVVLECSTFNPFIVHDRMRLALGRKPAPRTAEGALLHLRRGEFERAVDLLKDARDPESLYRLSEARLMTRGESAARPIWESLVADHPDSRWAWKAAANLSGSGLMTSQDQVKWPDEEVAASFDDSPWKPGGDAEAFLIGRQRKDGSFVTQEHLGSRTGPFTVAVTAIAGSALRESHPKEAKRALDFVLRELRLGTLSGADALFDYAIWGQVFALRYLVECDELDAAETIVEVLERTQRRAGGWGYFGKDATIGFVTAAAALALQEAQAAGVEVPPEVLNRALDALEAYRNENGTFRYMEGTKDEPAEASLRSPLYALSLKRSGRGDYVRKTLQNYLKHREHVIKEKGKTLCHTSPEGVASYYLLFGYAFGAEALAELPPGERSKFAEALRQDVLALQCEDGGYLDNPLAGRSYGTAMALKALRRLK